MLLPIHTPSKGKLRVIGYTSGSGNTLWKAYELQKEMEKTKEGCPFEIVGIFSDSPSSKAVETAKKLGVPYVAIDLKEYYAKREKPLKDRAVRAEYDREALGLLEAFQADMILLAGYVWATTDAVLDRYLVVNVHPADLSIMNDKGHRAYAGGNGVGAALDAKEPYIASSSHIATKELDAGPLLVISEKVDVDYALHPDGETRMRHYLGLVNDQSRLVGARTLLEIALGNFATDAQGKLHYKGKATPTGLRMENWQENRPLHERDIMKLVAPKSVAIIGASNKPGIGRAIVENMVNAGYEGGLYAVNLRGESVLSAKGYENVTAIPGDLDLAVITIPSAGVLAVAEECGKKGVKALICITAGFKEVGGAGVEAEEKLMAIVHKYNMRLTGPNCMGLLFNASKVNATILGGGIREGNIAMVTQSGAVGAALLDNSKGLGIGFSAIISLGNQSDVNVCDILQILDQDQNTKTIVMYMESILDPVRFCKVASAIKKPIFLIKSGKTEAGASAASSHTGSLAGNDKIAAALIEKAGIRRMNTLHETFLALSGVANMPPVKGDRVCVVTNAGGPGILISDALSNLGFKMPTLSDKSKAALAPLLMKEASVQNPIDVVAPAPAEHYANAIKVVAESGEFDAMVICCVPPATVDTTVVARACVEASKGLSIPVTACFVGDTMGEKAREVMHDAGFPVFDYPEQAAEVLHHMREKSATRQPKSEWINAVAIRKARDILDTAKHGEYLSNADAYRLLDCFGVRYAKNALITSEAELAALEIDYPVVAKIEHPEIVHKSDVGGVRLNIPNKAALTEVYKEFMGKFKGAVGVLVQEQVPQGIELIVGCANDPVLGNALMVGMGGTLVEIMQDVRFAYPPVDKTLAKEIIAQLRSYKLLEGYRGKKGVNVDALADMMVAMSNMLVSLPDIAELDLNPVIYHEAKGVFMAADIRIKRA